MTNCATSRQAASEHKNLESQGVLQCGNAHPSADGKPSAQPGKDKTLYFPYQLVKEFVHQQCHTSTGKDVARNVLTVQVVKMTWKQHQDPIGSQYQ